VDDIPSYLSDSDIFVLASWSEGRPMAVIEAMAAGLPVIASNIEGVNEIVQNDVTGLLFEPGDETQLAKHIANLSSDPEMRKRFGQAGRQYISDNKLLWSDTARQYEDIYCTVINACSTAVK